MFRSKPKHSKMLRIFVNSLSGRTDVRKYSFYNRLGISTKHINRGKRCNVLLYSLCNTFSCAGRREKSSGNVEPLKERVGYEGVAENEQRHGRIVDGPDSSVSDASQINRILSAKGKQVQCVLKEDNLELFKEIANGDDEVYSLLRQLQVRLDVTSSKFGVKLYLKKDEWVELLKSSPYKRKNFVAYLTVNTIRDIKRQIFQPPALYDLPFDDEETGENETNADFDVRCYHLFHNAMFLKLRLSAIKRMNYSRALGAMLYSSNIVFDCSYQEYMSLFETKELAKQLVTSMGLNIKSSHPFNLILCNFQEDGSLGKYLQKFNPLIFSEDYPITQTKKSYLDIFPKSKLVYLTPHCNTYMKTLDPGKIYIIGAFVDKSYKKPISLAIAKEQNLSMAKLPLDNYLDWGLGNKCLALPHVMKILLNLRTYDGDWHKALQAIPQRCLEKTRTKNQGKKATLDSIITEEFQNTSLDSIYEEYQSE